MAIVMLVAAFGLTSCDDFLDITPTGKVIPKTCKEYRALLTYEYKYFPEDRGLNVNRDILNRWTADNTNGMFTKLMVSTERPREYVQYNEYNLYSMLDTWIKSCNYARLQSLRLGYKMPSKWLTPIGLKSASLSLEARNLFVIASNYNNYLDPETMGNPYAQPIPKSFIFGVNVNF